MALFGGWGDLFLEASFQGEREEGRYLYCAFMVMSSLMVESMASEGITMVLTT